MPVGDDLDLGRELGVALDQPADGRGQAGAKPPAVSSATLETMPVTYPTLRGRPRRALGSVDRGRSSLGVGRVASYFDVHPDNPQPRAIGRSSSCCATAALIAYPTDSCYALGCQLGNKDGHRAHPARSATSTTGTTSPWSAATSPSSASSCSSTTRCSGRSRRRRRAVHVHPAGHEGGAAPAAAPEEADGRRPDPRPRGRAGAAGRAGRAAAVQHPAAARRRRADDPGLGDQGAARPRRSTRWSTPATAARSRPRSSTSPRATAEIVRRGRGRPSPLRVSGAGSSVDSLWAAFAPVFLRLDDPVGSSLGGLELLPVEGELLHPLLDGLAVGTCPERCSRTPCRLC